MSVLPRRGSPVDVVTRPSPPFTSFMVPSQIGHMCARVYLSCVVAGFFGWLYLDAAVSRNRVTCNCSNVTTRGAAEGVDPSRSIRVPNALLKSNPTGIPATVVDCRMVVTRLTNGFAMYDPPEMEVSSNRRLVVGSSETLGSGEAGGVGGGETTPLSATELGDSPARAAFPPSKSLYVECSHLGFQRWRWRE